MELNADQIIEILERSIRLSMDLNSAYPVITYSKLQDALALITSQEQRIKELTEENERLKDDCAKGASALIEEMQKNHTIKADTVETYQGMFAVHFGTYTNKDAIKVSEVFKLLNRFAKELEDTE